MCKYLKMDEKLHHSTVPKKKRGGGSCKPLIVLQLLDLQTSKCIVITAIIDAMFTERAVLQKPSFYQGVK